MTGRLGRRSISDGQALVRGADMSEEERLREEQERQDLADDGAEDLELNDEAAEDVTGGDGTQAWPSKISH